MKEKIKSILEKIVLLLTTSRSYYVFIAKPLMSSYEDPKCPMSWRGSGCYDIDIYAWEYHCFDVCARNEDEAIEIWKKWSKGVYDKVYNEVHTENQNGPAWMQRIAESNARSRANDESLYDCEILGAILNPDDTYESDLGDVEEICKEATAWDTKEGDCDLKEAIELLGINVETA